ncbi:alpha/beta fold hydrolase [Actinomadura opuntiae]|uniref:alpha/beta fold hydrolase n=1 Tax=Actinomadura sp. OS1-43 TaxID=604315 RepID=UPI00255AB57F|nr:alpha/beta hydrolase [Actinomadura sp. OS1-43]MDL4819110.1 alpha/beta hydrolase [Actinomadura sp. OS1-43]
MTFVLVHGAWHSPWYWREVTPHLNAPAVAVDLPSCGPPHGDMHDDARAIRDVLDAHTDVTLVAHSYGGMPATEAAAGHPAVRHLVYVAAYNADENETLMTFAAMAGTEPNINPQVDCDFEDGLLVFKPDRAEHVLFHDCPDPREAASHLRPMAPPFAQQSPNAVAWKTIPSTYVICTEDRATAVGVQRTLGTRATHVHDLPSSHSAFLSHPTRLAEIINTAH